MDSSCTTTLTLSSPLNFSTDLNKDVVVFDSTKIQKHSNIPTQFLWPLEDLVHREEDELQEPVIDLEGYFSGDIDATAAAAKLIKAACENHGFFQVINHGVDMSLVQDAYSYMDAFFKLPVSRKVVARREAGSLCGYSGAHADRFSSKLPWKETFSFTYQYGRRNGEKNQIHDYFKSVLGDDFEKTGLVYEQYCEAMEKLSLVIMELLGISLGVESKEYYRNFFEDGNSLMRCNYYPPCKEYGLTLGTGPHCDPTSLTILHQDQVGGLEVFANNKWQAVRPKPDAFVINIGDTFMALSNGRYKSCLHRAVVNREKVRRSLVFFVCPKEDKVIKPPKDIIINDSEEGEKRVYEDFKWSDLLEFTQKHYRADVSTLHNFFHWFLPAKRINYSAR